MRECVGSRRKEVIDKNVRFACDLHAHNLLLFRTVDAASLSEDTAKTLACGLVYLQTRHRWNERLLAVPETEVTRLSLLSCFSLSALTRPLRMLPAM